MADNKTEAVAWAALQKISGKEFIRELLPSCSEHAVELSIRGAVGRKAVHLDLDCKLNVGPDTERSSSTTPDVGQLVATLLSYLPVRQRANVLRELPEKFAELGTFPQQTTELVAESEQLLTRLRTKKQIPAKGAISCPYTLLRPTL